MSSGKEKEPIVNIAEVLPILGKISIFGGLSEVHLANIINRLRRISFKKDERVFRQGEESAHIYIVFSGEIRIVADIETRSLELVAFKTGDCFGETSVIGIQPHSATALALMDTELLVLSREALLSIFETDKDLFGRLILNIAREACRRLHNTDETLLHYVGKQK